MLSKKLLATLLTCAAIRGGAYAQSFNAARMDSVLSMVTTHNKASGIVLFRKNGKTLYQRGYGNAVNGAAPVAVNSNTAFRIGSITKTFTAAMIFQLIEEGKLTLDTKLSAFFPKVPGANAITMDHLLSHRSGLSNFTNDTTFYLHDAEEWNNARIMSLFEKLPSDFAPGEKTEYSNTNFTLLGMIVEKLDKRPYAESLQARIAGPLKLKSVRVFALKPGKDDALSYERSEGKWNATTMSHPSGPGGAGSISCNASDLAAFMEALNQGRVVKPASLARMQLMTDGMGRGLMQIPWGDRHAFGHGGKIDAFNSMAGYFPDDSVTLVTFTNGSGISPNDINIYALSVFYNEPGFKLPDFDKVVTVPDSLLKAYVGVYSFPAAGMDITVTQSDEGLEAQATGQGKFPLTAKASNEFVFEEAGIRIKFDKPAAGRSPRMMLYQGDSVVPFDRK